MKILNTNIKKVAEIAFAAIGIRIASVEDRNLQSPSDPMPGETPEDCRSRIERQKAFAAYHMGIFSAGGLLILATTTS